MHLSHLQPQVIVLKSLRFCLAMSEIQLLEGSGSRTWNAGVSPFVSLSSPLSVEVSGDVKIWRAEEGLGVDYKLCPL